VGEVKKQGVLPLLPNVVEVKSCAQDDVALRGYFFQVCAAQALGLGYLHMVHRLDVWTSGVLVTGRNPKAAAGFMADLASPERSLLKEYKVG
jgi:23S rRNA-/tRNA-specific pseudouridylate synthase